MKRMNFFIGLFALCCLPILFSSCSSKDEPEAQYLPPTHEDVEPYVNCATIDIRVNANAQTVEILTTTNAKWIVLSNCWGAEEEWIQCPRLLTDGEYMIIQFDVLENKSNTPREGDIYLELQERETKWWYIKNEGMPGFIITQAAAEP